MRDEGALASRGVHLLGMVPDAVPSERRYVRAGPPYEVSRMRRASPMGSATLMAAASAAMTGAAVRQPMVAPDAAVALPLTPDDDLGMADLSVSSRDAEMPAGAARGAPILASRAASATMLRRRPASSQDDGGTASISVMVDG